MNGVKDIFWRIIYLLSMATYTTIIISADPTFKFWNKTKNPCWITLRPNTLDKITDPTFTKVEPNQSYAENMVTGIDNYFYLTTINVDDPNILIIPFMGYQFTKNKNAYLQLQTKGNLYEFGPAGLTTAGTLFLKKEKITKNDIKQLGFYTYIKPEAKDKKPYLQLPGIQAIIKSNKGLEPLLVKINSDNIRLDTEQKRGSIKITSDQIAFINPYDILNIQENITPKNLEKVYSFLKKTYAQATPIISKAYDQIKPIILKQIPINSQQNPYIFIADALKNVKLSNNMTLLSSIFDTEEKKQQFIDAYNKIVNEHGKEKAFIIIDNQKDYANFRKIIYTKDTITLNPYDILGTPKGNAWQFTLALVNSIKEQVIKQANETNNSRLIQEVNSIFASLEIFFRDK
jgi:hypothetical protein